MASYFEKQAQQLYERMTQILDGVEVLKANRSGGKIESVLPLDLRTEFFRLVDQVTLSLMEDRGNYYGYFLFQMTREIRMDLASATGVNFKGAQYVIYFNPLIFLTLNLRQMESTIKHEIHHILSMHLTRAKALSSRYSTLASNMAMDVVVNQYLTHLPPYAMTLERVNHRYGLKLEPYESFEYYLEKIQTELSLLEVDEEGEVEDSEIETEYNVEKTHDIWEESDRIDEQIVREFTEQLSDQAQKGQLPDHIEEMITALKKSKGELPWHLYLNRLMGTVAYNHKQTITRRNRRQPERLDLKGRLRSHKAEIAVALDTSGSISDEEFRQAIQEVLSIVKNYNHEITLIECDNQIRRTYQVKSTKDIKERMPIKGATSFSPVFEYANQKKINLLIYFTDGKGEERLTVIPRGYKVLWVISGSGDTLSLKEAYGAVKQLSKVEIKDTTLEMSDVRSDGYSMNHQEPLY